MDTIVQRAREHHRQSLAAGELAARHKQQRDDLIRRLRHEDPIHWSYGRLASAVGCSPETIAAVVKHRR